MVYFRESEKARESRGVWKKWVRESEKALESRGGWKKWVLESEWENKERGKPQIIRGDPCCYCRRHDRPRNHHHRLERKRAWGPAKSRGELVQPYCGGAENRAGDGLR